MKLTWYFDVLSPFAYLQLQRFADLPKGTEVVYKPILIAGLLNHWKSVGPAEIPPKRQFTYQHCYWMANKLGVTYKMPSPHPFNPLTALRTIIALGSDEKAVRGVFDVIWGQGFALPSEEGAAALNAHFGEHDWLAMSQQPQIKQALIDNTQQAAQRGVFGVPTFVPETETDNLFWGLDAFEMLQDYLQSPQTFYGEDMQALKSIPVGVSRQ